MATLAPLPDPVRRALYELVAASPAPVDRDEAATRAGIARAPAAFHLDKLIAAGLLVAEYRRRGTRSGPGAGRPAKFYRRATIEVEISIPPRRYDLAGEILAAAVDEVPSALTAVRDSAFRAGRRLAEDAPPADLDGILELLRGQGYEPSMESGDPSASATARSTRS